MKIAIIGIGQCGCNIADEFYCLGEKAKRFFGRRTEIITDTLAINTDTSDLRGFRHIPEKNRMLVGAGITRGHGVGKINTVAAKIFSDDHTMLAEEIKNTRHFRETDAVVVIASAGGGTGSGGIGQVTKVLSERLRKKVIAIVILPYAYEETGATSYALTNAATCLATVTHYADTVFLLDNERFSRGISISMAKAYQNINRQMVNNFYDLFCAGEEQREKFIGSKVVDAGDILATLSGFAVIGRGEVPLSTFRLRKYSLKEGAKRAIAIIDALNEAKLNLSTNIELADARKILVMLCCPQDYITQPALEELYTTISDEAPKAEIRIGDYPRRAREVSVTIIASELTKIDRISKLYAEAKEVFKTRKGITTETERLMKKSKTESEGIERLA